MLFNSAWIFVAFLTGLSQGQKFALHQRKDQDSTCESVEAASNLHLENSIRLPKPTGQPDNYGRKSKGSGTFTNCNCDGRNKLYCPDIKGSSVPPLLSQLPF
ncbi:hypothetical protein PGTUg99_000279 [Puccinia graminis f. sp. tritici]|uniref:Uncharacterized protein n=1 Tax=Puccinia graminis f. sp. tritici TaxID=56615 RepID=A0A5B0LJW3_PUCGR|nr:hypothetical protein PGTUg99_000279 [Puccinia graminis f. sp. tritici]